MRLLLCLAVLLIPSLAQTPTENTKIRLAGIKTVSECSMQLGELQAELQHLEYPANWIIEIDCNPIAWQQAWRKAGGPPTNTGFTQLKNRITVLNGSIFRQQRSFYRRTIAHELAHIKCACASEDKAERLAVELEKASTTVASDSSASKMQSPQLSAQVERF